MAINRPLFVGAILVAANHITARSGLIRCAGSSKATVAAGLLRDCGQHNFDARVDSLIAGGTLDAWMTDANLTSVIDMWPYESVVKFADFSSSTILELRAANAVFLNRIIRATISTEAFKVLLLAEAPELEREISRYVSGGEACGACKTRLFNALTIRYPLLRYLADAYALSPGVPSDWLESFAGQNDAHIGMPVRKKNGAGEVFECDDDPSAYSTLMAEVAQLYHYRSAELRHGSPCDGKMQIWLA